MRKACGGQIKRILGNPPHREQGHWREGFIVVPSAPRTPSNVRWLH
jgi:hypothetical protein